MPDRLQGKETPIDGETTLRLWKAAHAGGKRERDAFVARVYEGFRLYLLSTPAQRRKLASVGLHDFDEVQSLAFAGLPSKTYGTSQGLLEKLLRVDPNKLNGGGVCYSYLRTAFARQVATIVRSLLQDGGKLKNETAAAVERWESEPERRHAARTLADDTDKLRERITEAAGVRTVGPDGAVWLALLDAVLAGKSPTFDVVPESAIAVLGGSAYAVYLRSIVKLNRAAARVAGDAV